MKNPEEYVLWWLQVATQDLEDDPEHTLHDHTHPNYSGGVRGWTLDIDELYHTPKTMQEWLLAREVDRVLDEAFQRSVKRTRGQIGSTRFPPFDLLDIAETFRLAHLRAQRDVLTGLHCKLMLNGWCQQFLKGPFDTKARNGFGVMFPVKEIYM